MWIRHYLTYHSFRDSISTEMRLPGWLSRLLARLAIASLLVFGCYRLEWHWLRNITTWIIVELSHSLGLPMNQPAVDVVEMFGTQYGFYISCTMIDVFFVAAALIWKLRERFVRNLMRLAYLFLFVFALNILRLEIGFQLLFRLHVPEIVEHEIVGGITYFLVLVKIVRLRKKKTDTVKAVIAASSTTI